MACKDCLVPTLTRHKVAHTLYNNGKGYSPNSKNYSYEVEKFIIKDLEIDLENLSTKNEKVIKMMATKFASKAKTFYNENSSTMLRMLEKKQNWFSEIIQVRLVSEDPTPQKPPKKKGGRPTKAKGRGAPPKTYDNSQTRSQKDKANKLASDNSLEKLLHAAMIKAKKEGHKDAAWAIDFLKSNPSVKGSLFRQTMKNTLKPVTAFTDFECLALIIELKLTQRQYKKLRKMQKTKGAHMYVSWGDIIAVKEECEPEGIDASKTGEVKVPMQSVVDHQATHIMDLPEVKEKYQKLLDSGKEFKLTMFGKYGSDGTQSKTEWSTADAGNRIYYLCIK